MNERFQEYPKLKELIRLKVTDLYFIKIIMSLFYLYHSVVHITPLWNYVIFTLYKQEKCTGPKIYFRICFCDFYSLSQNNFMLYSIIIIIIYLSLI